MLSEWHDFFIVIGAASGTLIGAMFVVVSIGSGILTRERAAAGTLFLTPTIVHLSIVLFSCAFVVVPTLGLRLFAAGFLITGVVGMAYAGRTVYFIRRRKEVERIDHVWYGFAPVVAYLVMIAGALLVLGARRGGIEALALAQVLLLIACIRNAWDLIIYFVQQHSGR